VKRFVVMHRYKPRSKEWRHFHPKLEFEDLQKAQDCVVEQLDSCTYIHYDSLPPIWSFLWVKEDYIL